MLFDLLDSGIYGDASISWKRSGNITLSAISTEKNKRKKWYSRDIVSFGKRIERVFSILEKTSVFAAGSISRPDSSLLERNKTDVK